MDDSELDTDEIAGIYDELLKTYSKQWEQQGHRSLHLGYYDEDHDEPASAAMNTMRVLSEAADVEETDRILNIGCGAGEDSVWNARAYGASVVGVNISDTQLELARENAREHDVEGLTTFRNDDFHDLSTVDDDSIDLVWGLEAISHSPDRARVVDQLERVLVSDGRVAFTDLFLRSETPPADATERIEHINDALGIRLGTVKDFEQLLADGGFTTVTVREMTTGILPCTRRRRRFSRVAHPAGRVLSSLGVVSDTQVDAFSASSAIHELASDGVLGYFMVTADRDEPEH